MKQKYLWGGAALIALGATGAYVAYDHALRNPNGPLARFTMAAAVSGVTTNPMRDLATPASVEPQTSSNKPLVADPAEETIEPLLYIPVPLDTTAPPKVPDNWFTPDLGIPIQVDQCLPPIETAPKPMPYADETLAKGWGEFVGSIMFHGDLTGITAGLVGSIQEQVIALQTWQGLFGIKFPAPHGDSECCEQPQTPGWIFGSDCTSTGGLVWYRYYPTSQDSGQVGGADQDNIDQGHQLIDPPAFPRRGRRSAGAQQSQGTRSQQLIDPPAFGAWEESSAPVRQTEVIQIRHAQAADVAAAVSGMFGANVVIVTESVSNKLIVQMSPQDLERLRGLLKEVDVPIPQVRIDVMIVEAELTTAEMVLLNFLGSTESSTFSRSNNFAFSSSTDKVNLLIGTLQGRYNVVAAPRITTGDNQAARILVGQSVPYVVVAPTHTGNSATPPTLQYRDIGTEVQVTPKISPDGQVMVRIIPTITRVAKSMVDAGAGIMATAFDVTTMESTVMLRNGETAVLGGMLAVQDTGFANKKGTQLVVFVTAHLDHSFAVPSQPALSGEEPQSLDDWSQQLIDPPARGWRRGGGN